MEPTGPADPTSDASRHTPGRGPRHRAGPAAGARGRRVLITGAATGLGHALAERMHAAGDRVLATDLPLGRPGSLSDGIDYQPLDVRSDANWVAARERVEEAWGGLDVLINNAGLATGGRIDVATMDEWHRAVEVNLLGVVRGCHTFAGLMKRQRSGHLVNIASLAGLVHPPAMGSSAAAEAGVVGLSESLFHELAPYGVLATAVCPSYFRTNLASSLAGADADMLDQATRLIEEAPLDVDTVALEVLEGIDRREPLVLPDERAREAYRLKLTDRPAYDAMMQRTAVRAHERDSRDPQNHQRDPQHGLQGDGDAIR